MILNLNLNNSFMNFSLSLYFSIIYLSILYTSFFLHRGFGVLGKKYSARSSPPGASA
jgi:hypothetical protein